jgi:hypothetical protein
MAYQFYPRTPKRQFWQFRLSTVLVFALFSAGVLYLNLIPHGTYVEVPTTCEVSGTEKYTTEEKWLSYGWPEEVSHNDPNRKFQPGERGFSIVVDVIVGMLIVFCIAATTEYWTREPNP